jgi:hypothetical protein
MTECESRDRSIAVDSLFRGPRMRINMTIRVASPGEDIPNKARL